MTEVEITKVKPGSIEAQKLKALEVAVKEAKATEISILERAEIVSGDVKVLEAEIVSLNNKKAILEDYIAKYNERKLEIEGSLDDTFEDLKMYNKDVKQKEKKIKELNIELDQLDIPKIVKRTEDQTRSKIFDELKEVLKDITAKQKVVEALRVETDDLKVQKESLQKNVKDLIDSLENAKLHLTVKELRVIIKDLEALSRNKKNEIDDYETMLATFESKLEQIKRDILLAEERCELSQSQYKEKQKELTVLTNEANEATERTAQAVKEKEQAEAELLAKKEEYASMQDQIDSVHKRSVALDQREKIIRAQYQALGVEYVEYKED